jgi:hypothetical protein
MRLETTGGRGFGRAVYFTWGRLSVSLTLFDGNAALSVVWADIIG